MTTKDRIKLEGEITEDGRLLVDIPPDAPRGVVEIWVQRARQPEPEATVPDEDNLDAGLAELLSDEALMGRGLSAEEILKSPEIGAGAFDHITDSAEYVENLRKRLAARHRNI